MISIIAGKTYTRADFEGAVIRVDRIEADGTVIGHTYVPGGTLSTACVTKVDLLRTRIVPQN